MRYLRTYYISTLRRACHISHMVVTDPLATGPPIWVLCLHEWGWVGVGGYTVRRPGDMCLLGHIQGWGERGGVGFHTPCPVWVIWGKGQEGRGVPFVPWSAPVCMLWWDGANPTHGGRGKPPGIRGRGRGAYTPNAPLPLCTPQFLCICGGRALRAGGREKREEEGGVWMVITFPLKRSCDLGTYLTNQEIITFWDLVVMWHVT